MDRSSGRLNFSSIPAISVASIKGNLNPVPVRLMLLVDKIRYDREELV